MKKKESTLLSFSTAQSGLWYQAFPREPETAFLNPCTTVSTFNIPDQHQEEARR
jgi:hypothetical protein